MKMKGPFYVDLYRAHLSIYKNFKLSLGEFKKVTLKCFIFKRHQSDLLHEKLMSPILERALIVFKVVYAVESSTFSKIATSFSHGVN